MLLQETYIVCNPQNISLFRKIPLFKLDLGKQLIDSSGKDKIFQPGDVRVQTHLIFYNELIMKCGTIGILNIYNNNTVDRNTIMICNGQIRISYTIDNNMSMYDNMNLMLDLFMKANGMIPKETPKEEVVVEEIKHVLPTKPLSEMSMEERIAYARSRS
jgi:hypothetical protein